MEGKGIVNYFCLLERLRGLQICSGGLDPWGKERVVVRFERETLDFNILLRFY